MTTDCLEAFLQVIGEVRLIYRSSKRPRPLISPKCGCFQPPSNLLTQISITSMLKLCGCSETTGQKKCRNFKKNRKVIHHFAVYEAKGQVSTKNIPQLNFGENYCDTISKILTSLSVSQ